MRQNIFTQNEILPEPKQNQTWLKHLILPQINGEKQTSSLFSLSTLSLSLSLFLRMKIQSHIYYVQFNTTKDICFSISFLQVTYIQSLGSQKILKDLKKGKRTVCCCTCPHLRFPHCSDNHIQSLLFSLIFASITVK